MVCHAQFGRHRKAKRTAVSPHIPGLLRAFWMIMGLELLYTRLALSRLLEADLGATKL